MNDSERAAPVDEAELSSLLGGADRDGRAVRVTGGNTLAGMGARPAVDLEILTTTIAGIIDFEPDDLTVAVLAGTRLSELATTLAERRQMLPFDAPLATNATVGGTLAAGWRGPRRHIYGPPRDWVIGSHVVLADGTVARAGGMVVKNVAGYDLSRLYVGSFGTLSVLVRANLKTLALPERTRAFFAALPDGSLEPTIAQLRDLRVVPAAAFWFDGFSAADDRPTGDDGRLAIFLEGSTALVDRAGLELRSALGRGGVPAAHVLDNRAPAALERIVDAYVSALGQRSISYRIGSLPSEAIATAEAAAECARRFELRHERIVDLMNGDTILRVSELDVRRLAACMNDFDDALHRALPNAIVIACEHPDRDTLQLWGREPGAIATMRALKHRFDPNNVLNPGRFVGGI
ncbi:MAG TPA: FAD-binding oxidoreductase [Candidatus Tumulicola sp.]